MSQEDVNKATDYLNKKEMLEEGYKRAEHNEQLGEQIFKILGNEDFLTKMQMLRGITQAFICDETQWDDIKSQALVKEFHDSLLYSVTRINKIHRQEQLEPPVKHRF